MKNLRSRLTNVSRQMHCDGRHWNECSVNTACIAYTTAMLINRMLGKQNGRIWI